MLFLTNNIAKRSGISALGLLSWLAAYMFRLQCSAVLTSKWSRPGVGGANHRDRRERARRLRAAVNSSGLRNDD